MIVLYGDKALGRLRELAPAARRILLVTGKGSFEASGAAAQLAGLAETVEIRRWSDFSPNTDSDDVWAGLGIVRSFAPDTIVAVGGGSAMDMAKLLATSGDIADKDALLAYIRSGKKAATKTCPLVLAPTTSGSGSEATHFAVVYIGHEKFSVAGDVMRADGVILDPTLTQSGTPYQKATSGIDAVCQAIESLWATGGTEKSRRYARHALCLLLRHIKHFVMTGTIENARGMAIGSYLAGRAIDISKTTVSHALSYAITKQYGISHGHAVSLTLGAFIEAHAGTPHMRYILEAFGCDTAAEAAARFRALLGDIGLSAKLSDIGIDTDEARMKIISSVNLERLSNNPVQFSFAEMDEILRKAG